MLHRTRTWVASAFIAGLCLSFTAVQAQDYPTHKGNNQRVGHTVDPFTYSPGVANLRWWYPNSTSFSSATYLRDNTSALTSKTAGFLAPTISGEAYFPYIPVQSGNVTEDARVSSFFDPASPNYGLRPIVPAYHYAFTTASRWTGSVSTYDPTVPQAGVVDTYTWDVTPTTGLPNNYAVYVWLPAGGTDTSGVGTNYVYTQRYFVYKVQYGSGQSFTDVIDTSVAGSGWVRLGSGGSDSNKAVSYNGTGSVTITLYNTIPRDSLGNLLQPSNVTNSLVYADAAMIVPLYGTFSASPVASVLSDGTTTAVIAAVNQYDVGLTGTDYQTNMRGIVSSYLASNGTKRWDYSPLDESESSIYLDAPNALVTANPPGWATSTAATGYLGANYFGSNLVQLITDATDVVYSPTLSNGDYDIFVWLSGSNNGEDFGHQVAYEINEGATVSTVYVNQDSNTGWVKLGTRRYKNSTTAKLVVHALNFSNDPTDFTAGRKAYSDAVRFVGASNLAITSTPIQVTGAMIKLSPAGAPTPTDVTIVAAENGRIYCLDSVGNANGTTNVYWTYPSTPDKTNAAWTDPNQVAGLDGVGGIAQMPIGSGFDLSSGLVQRIGGVDYLYIAARNGRVYCIDITGRGDFNLATRRPGTTTRVWSFPDDYPSTPKTSSLGAFTGSVSFATTTDGPTVFLPAPQGRIYALNAVGDPVAKTTTVRWQYPLATSPTLGKIAMTPAIDFGRIFFGTLAKDDSSRGEFYSLNVNDGSLVWKFDGTTTVPADDFIASPTTVPTAMFTSPAQVNTVYAANDNRFIYALDANGNGDGTTNILWSSDELSVGVQAALSFVPLQGYNLAGAITALPTPMLMVPTRDGRIVGLYADSTLNRFGTKRAYEFTTGSSFIASVANARNWMFAGDTDGRIMAFNTGSGYLTPGDPPGIPSIIENDPAGDTYRNCKVKFVNLATYKALRDGTMTYAQADAAAEIAGNPPAFEWGQTLYALVYNFPHQTLTPSGTTVAPPSVNYAFSVEGSATRTVAVESRMFQHLGAGNPPTSPIDNTVFLDGYTIVAFALQSGGGMSLAPGNGQMTISISTSALNNAGARQNIAMDIQNTRKLFTIANPLALLMNGTGDLSRAVGYTLNPSDPEALENGCRYIGSGSKRQDLLLGMVGVASHGQSKAVSIDVVDRSLMTLLRGPGRGLDNVRFTRSDLNWMGGIGAVYHSLDATLYPDYEDLPSRYPNDSLDYPDIKEQNVSVVKSQSGNVENPLFSGVSLTPPTFTDPLNPDPTTRSLQTTPFDITVDVPRFQPPNNTLTQDSAMGAAIPAGYLGRQIVFIDSSGTGSFTRGGGRRQAYRTFRLSTIVDVDENIRVTTPTVDLGSLTQGAGFAPAYPWDVANSPLSPITGQFQGLFKTFRVITEGNVNLRNLRLAKQAQTGANLSPWPIYSTANESQTWLETRGNVFTSLDDDTRWLIVDDNGNAHHNVILQKPRPGDRVGTELDVNTPRRANSVTGATQKRLNSNQPSLPPMIAAAIPIGFPVGTYGQTMRVINKDSVPNPAAEVLSLDASGNGLDTYSDPTFYLKMIIREGRLTNSFTGGASTMVDNLVNPNQPTPRFMHTNMQPTALRTPLGSLVVAWASTRNAWNEAQPGADAKLDNQWRIYVASLQGQTPGATAGMNPLRELNFFGFDSPNSWFRQSGDAPFPVCTNNTQANTLFNADTANGESVDWQTVKFGSPTLPAHGYTNPLGGIGSVNSGAYIAFLGDAQLATPTGRSSMSKLFIAPMTTNAQGAPTLGAPILNTKDDGTIRKGKPSVVQVGDRATIVFAGGASGKTQLMYTTYDPSITTIEDRWSVLRSFSLGTGFEYANSPSIYARRYNGLSIPSLGLNNGQSILEMSFVGKLRGRPTTEVFFGRVLSDDNGAPILAGGNPRFALLPNLTRDLLFSTGDPSVYQAQGVAWNTRSAIRLEQSLNNVVTDLEVADGSRTFDQTTGILSFNTTLGGKVYIDANIGTVRFSSAIPTNKATLLLTYQPRFLRVSEPGTAGACTSSGLLFDNRQGSDASYWVGLSGPLSNTDNDAIRSSRYVFTYVRAASGGGQTARPYMRSLRLGVQCPSPIPTDGNGVVQGLVVTGNTGPYQVDAPNGRIYFTDVDEYRDVTVSYPGQAAGICLVSLAPERKESPILIEQAVNEAGLTAFLDPLDIGGQIGARRPGLIWLLWSSTRAGSPDVYFETIAPRFSLLPAGN